MWREVLKTLFTNHGFVAFIVSSVLVGLDKIPVPAWMGVAFLYVLIEGIAKLRPDLLRKEKKEPSKRGRPRKSEPLTTIPPGG
ncbi:MAG: hypothetical protein DRJ03_14520 [Chloroflexi bacterium]|nr:MAG: hypothetical protein DRJ03_14520 [Chloroflexota bacterium]